MLFLMYFFTNKYRTLIAKLLCIWTLTIVISGVVFMHKEVTSTGEIVTHVHPYDFTKKNQQHHHQSDDEIQFLNIVFHGAFILGDIVVFEAPVLTAYYIPFGDVIEEKTSCYPFHAYFLRGPPHLA